MTIVSGTYQNETLYGLSSNDSLDGGAGADTLFGLAGNDYLFGGSNQTAQVQILVEDGYWEEGPEVEKQVWVEDWVEEEIYNDQGDVIGTELVDYGYWDVVYEPGEDVWVPPQYDYEDEWVFDSSDSLLGGAGNDTLKGSPGGFFVPIDTGERRAEAPDTLTGGAGDDLYLVYSVDKYDDEAGSWPGDTIIEKAGEGTDTIRLYANPTILNEDSYDTENGIYILPNNIENIELYDDALHVIGSSLANRITGNAKSNYLDGGKGNDTLTGGAGNDYYEVDSIGDLVIESANGGTDDRIFSQVSYTLPAQVENLVLEEAPVALNGTGNNLSNEIYGNALNNVLTGNAGNDSLFGAEGADVFQGGAGNDILWADMEGSEESDYEDSGDYEDPIDGGSPEDDYSAFDPLERAVFSGRFEDYAIETIDASSLLVRDLRSGSPDGTDTLIGIGTLSFSNGERTVSDILSGPATLTGGTGHDNLVANRDGQYLDALAGNDTLGAGTFSGVTLSGGAGNDTYLISSYATQVLESTSGGADTVRLSTTTGQPYNLPGEVENLELTGEATDAYGNALANRLTGNAKGNFLDGLGGNDTMSGGSGNDYYVVASAGDLVVEAASAGNDTIRALTSYTMPANVEVMALWDSAANGTGNALNNDIDANAAANLLLGLAGNDDIFGAGANDTVRGGTGNDFLDGGTGNDLVEGDEGNDMIIGKEDSDTLRGGDGLDTLDGWTGNDLLEGDDDIDNLLGKEGNDTLDGGAGADVMLGGTGNDLYIIDDVNDYVEEIGNQGTDTVLVNGDSITGTDAGWDGITSIEVFRSGNGANSFALGAKAQAAGIVRAIGGSGNDTLNASAFSRGILLEGGAANDLLRSGAGSDTLLGGIGNDSLAAGRGTDTVSGGDGNDSLLIDWSALSGATISHKVEKVSNSFKGTITAKNSSGAVLSQVSLDSIESIQLNGKAWSPEPPKPGVSLSRTSTAAFTTEQGGKVEYSVVLKAQPYEQPVYVDFQISDATEAKVLTPRLSFTPSNWSIPQTLVVQGVDDYLNDKNVAYTVNGKIVTEALNYNRLTVDAINLINNDDGQDIPMEWQGTSGIDYKDGGNGNDILYAGGSQDQVRGGRGDDEIYGEGDNDRLLGEDGNDEIYGGYGKDTLDGGNGNDSVFGEQGQDTLLGGAGNDYMDGGLLNDSMSGGGGNDTYIVDNAGDIINDLGATSDVDVVQVIQTISYTLPANIENAAITASGNGNLTGNALNNGLTGNADKNILDGGTGNDKLDGGAGSDSLLGGVGNDALLGGAGNDTMRGGDGVDLADFAAAGVDISIDLTTGRAKGDGTDLLFDIENILAGEGDDTLLGSTAANDLDGGAGTDNLNGGAGNDTLAGCFFGANGGRSEIDTLVGGVGNDIFQLGYSSGRFYDDGNTKNAGRTDYVLITDFTVGQDKLQLDGAAAGYYLAASGVTGVTGTGLYAEQGTTDELIAILRSANTTALNAANTVNTALFV